MSKRCDWLDWHEVKSLVGAKLCGINLKATCNRCGRTVLRDSHRNWFAISRREEYLIKLGQPNPVFFSNEEILS